MIGDDRRRIEAVARPLVSVLMVTYNARDWVTWSLDALVRHTPEPYELTVVDNDSTDGTRALLRESLRGARIIGLPENIGFGLGNDEHRRVGHHLPRRIRRRRSPSATRQRTTSS